MSVFVQRARSKTGIVPRWDGGRFSLSTQLSAAVRRKLEEASRGVYESPEMRAVRPLMELQAMKSRIPRPDELLIETVALGRIHNVFLFPFQGRQAHEGMGALLAYRWSKKKPISVTSTVNDYGIGLSSDEPMRADEQEWRALLSTEGLLDDLLACLNASNLARRQFRDIARIAGLVLPGFPGTPKPSRHLQASSEMFFDVFEEFDPDNLLMDQARREVLESQLELARLRMAMEAAGTHRMVMVEPDQLTPLSFPIWAENLRATTLSSEKWADMVRKMVVELEHASDEEQPGRGAGKRRGRAARGRGRKRLPR
jgi:ATP-dependent Lhr-like helicase